MCSSDLTLLAATHYNKQLAFTTFMNDPMLRNLTPEEGETLFETMLSNTRKYLPEQWFKA